MRTALKWMGIAFAGLVGILLIAYVAVYFISEQRITRAYEIEVEPVPIPENVPPIDEVGFPLIVIAGCQECHGEDLGGQVLVDDPLSMRLVAPNITAGEGGVVRDYSVTDWVRSLWHGVDPDGDAILMSPSDVFTHLSGTDLGLLIAYMEKVPPVDRELTESTLGPLGRVMLLLDLLPPYLITAETIDHEAERLSDSPPIGTVEYGEYLASFCTFCHQENFAGTDGPVDDRFSRSPMNLTPGGLLATWSEEDFANTLRTGIAPDGYELDPEEMPWETIGKVTDEQLHSVWLYLQTIPAVETQHR